MLLHRNASAIDTRNSNINFWTTSKEAAGWERVEIANIVVVGCLGALAHSRRVAPWRQDIEDRELVTRALVMMGGNSK